MGKITLDKLDAAARQLTTAIELWFTDSDPISIHTLACSAHQLVHDLNKRAGGRDLIYDTLVIKDEYRKEWIDKVKGPYNFLKHADKDPAAKIEFDPVANEFFIMFTCLGLELLGVKPNIARAGFTLYQMLSHPDILTPQGETLLAPYPDSMKSRALEIPKKDFFAVYAAYHKSQGKA